MQKFITYSDAGSLRLFTSDVAFNFSNGYGDGENTVCVYDKTDVKPDFYKMKFLDCVSAREDDTVSISEYDCSYKGIFTFKRGRYFVYLEPAKNNWPTFHIAYYDDYL